MGINLKSIKIENVKSVAKCFSSDTGISRSDISAKTGLSLVTVGKIVDAMIGEGALIEEKRSSSSAGRRAGWLVLNPHKTIAVVEIYNNGAEIRIFDIHSNVLESFSGKTEREDGFDEMLGDLLAEASMCILQKYGAESCIGVGVAVDSAADKERCKELVGAFFPDIAVCVDYPVNYSAILVSYSAENNGTLLFISVCRESVCGAFVLGHIPFLRKDGLPADFGSVVFPDGESFIEKLTGAADRQEFAALLGECVCNTLKIVMPDAVVLEIDRECGFDGIEEQIDKTVAEKIGHAPQCSLSVSRADAELSSSCRGAILTVCKNWLESFAFEE